MWLQAFLRGPAILLVLMVSESGALLLRLCVPYCSVLSLCSPIPFGLLETCVSNPYPVGWVTIQVLCNLGGKWSRTFSIVVREDVSYLFAQTTKMFRNLSSYNRKMHITSYPFHSWLKKKKKALNWFRDFPGGGVASWVFVLILNSGDANIQPVGRIRNNDSLSCLLKAP